GGEVILQFALDDLLDDGGRFAGDGGGGDLAFLGQLDLGHLVAGNVGRIRRRDLKAEILHECFESVVARNEIRLAVDLDQHADFAADVDVALDEPLLRGAAGELV